MWQKRTRTTKTTKTIFFNKNQFLEYIFPEKLRGPRSFSSPGGNFRAPGWEVSRKKRLYCLLCPCGGTPHETDCPGTCFVTTDTSLAEKCLFGPAGAAGVQPRFVRSFGASDAFLASVCVPWVCLPSVFLPPPGRCAPSSRSASLRSASLRSVPAAHSRSSSRWKDRGLGSPHRLSSGGPSSASSFWRRANGRARPSWPTCT